MRNWNRPIHDHRVVPQFQSLSVSRPEVGRLLVRPELDEDETPVLGSVAVAPVHDHVDDILDTLRAQFLPHLVLPFVGRYAPDEQPAVIQGVLDYQVAVLVGYVVQRCDGRLRH